MKKILFIIFLGISFYSSAQTKVKITYDANGSRIKREVVSTTGGRPGTGADSIGAENGTLNSLLAEEDNSLFKVYPNPANNIVHVQTDAGSLAAGDASVRLLDIQGRVLQTMAVTAEVTNIDISQLADGTYYVILVRKEQQDIAKIVKQTAAGR
ncbi:MAG TPA: T9SS type A sorting domain-containing protein [Emticicia sp.]